MTDKFPVPNPIKHGRNYFARRLHYAAGEVRSYTLYFPEEQLKKLEEKLTKKFDDEIIEMKDAWEQTKGEKPSMKDTHVFREAVITAVQTAHHGGARTCAGQQRRAPSQPRDW